MSAGAAVLQLVRAHYTSDEAAFASAAAQLARAAKSSGMMHQINDIVRRGQQSRNQRTMEPKGLQQLKPPPPRTTAGGLLQTLEPISFPELVLDAEIQGVLDELAEELEYREELKARKLRPRNRLLFWGPPGNGKCLQIGTPVLRFDGRIVPVEEVRTGDLLMGPDSKPRRVLGTTRGRGQLYRVHPVKGDPWVCNDVHVLTVVHSTKSEIVDIDVQTYLSASKEFKHQAKLFTPETGVDFAPAPELPIDPYFLGVWYGDGSKSLDARGRLAGVAVSKPDPEIRELMETVAAQYGAGVRVDGGTNGDCPTYWITNGQSGGRENVLLNQLRTVVGDCLALPHAYLTASRSNREQFLAGLLDTDGTENYGGFEIAQKVRGFADGIAFLARSLGLRATMRPKVVNGETYWRLMLSGDCSRLPLRIDRKRAAARQQKKRANRTGFTVEPIGHGEYAGFELDGDGRFLLGDFTVTHNTASATALATQLGLPAYGVSLPDLIGSHIGETGGNLGKIFESIGPDTVVVFDEIDAIGSTRGEAKQGADKEHNSTVNTFLTLLDRNRHGVIVATTNRPDIIDAALLRRFDEKVFFPAPGRRQLENLAKKLCEKYGIELLDVSGCENFDAAAKHIEREARRMVMAEIRAAEAASEDEDGDEEAN